MKREERIGVYEKLLSTGLPCVIYCRGLEPDDDMIEVGIASVEAVFDWKMWQKEECN